MKLRRTVFSILVAITLLSGCAIHPQKGSFLGSDAAGWVRSRPSGSGGLTAYEPPYRALRRLEITFSTSDKRHVYAHLSYLEEKLELDGRITVAAPNSGPLLELPAQKLLEGLDIPIGDAKSFRITIPGFTAKGRQLPPLVADFIWSEETYYYIRGLQ